MKVDALFDNCHADVVAPSSKVWGRSTLVDAKKQRRCAAIEEVWDHQTMRDVVQAQGCATGTACFSAACDLLKLGSPAGSDDRERRHDDPSRDVARSQPSRRAHANASSLGWASASLLIQLGRMHQCSATCRPAY